MKTCPLLVLLLLVTLLAACATPATPAATAVPPTQPPVPTATHPAPSATTAASATPAPSEPSATTTATQPAPRGTAITITWWGQSTFVLSFSTGLKALLDPTGSGTGYQIPTQSSIDLVTASHEHSDHNAANLASGSPLVLKGLAGNDWARIDQTVKGVRVRTVGTYHDGQNGTQRGKNAIFIFEVDGLRLAHLGDLGHTLSPEQVKEVGPVDIILIPVGGFYTIDAQAAAYVVTQLSPKVIIPMHYKTADLSASLASVLAPVDNFTRAIGEKARIEEVSQTATIEKDRLPTQPTIWVMKYKP